MVGEVRWGGARHQLRHRGGHGEVGDTQGGEAFTDALAQAAGRQQVQSNGGQGRAGSAGMCGLRVCSRSEGVRRRRPLFDASACQKPLQGSSTIHSRLAASASAGPRARRRGAEEFDDLASVRLRADAQHLGAGAHGGQVAEQVVPPVQTGSARRWQRQEGRALAEVRSVIPSMIDGQRNSQCPFAGWEWRAVKPRAGVRQWRQP